MPSPRKTLHFVLSLVTLVLSANGSPRRQSTQLSIIGEITMSAGIEGLALEGEYAFVTEWERLNVINVSDPHSPQVVAQIDLGQTTNGVFVSGGLAYVASYNPEFYVIDVSNPLQPALIGSCALGRFGGWRTVYVSQGIAYVTNSTTGAVYIIDVGNPRQPAVLSIWGTDEWGADNTMDVYVSDRVAYLASWQNGLKIIDTADPRAPRLLGSYDTPGRARAVHVSGHFAYVADGLGGLLIIDVAATSQPTYLGSFTANAHASDVYVVRGLAYAVWEEELRLLNVTDPDAPTQLAAIRLGWHGRANTTVVANGHIFIADGNKLLIIREVTTVPTYVQNWALYP